MEGICRSRILRTNEVAARLGISRTTLWRWERRGLIPRKRRLGPNTVGWLASEIENWFETVDAQATTNLPAIPGAKGGQS